eukprot:gene13177-15486_t
MNFQKEIEKWYEINKRDLPWRHTRDPYVIWLSEIILQQTRVEQGLPYFKRFLEAYPSVKDFAAADEQQVLKLWQGLGYYSRGRNMLFTAREVERYHEGRFPVQYEELIKLKGIGEYTAAAISSFSSGEARAVLDGNVFRVLSRYFGIDTPINSSEGKKEFTALAQELLKGQNAMVYNQAIMEFGALQCKPKSPDCIVCPLQESCYALRHKRVNDLPVKLKKLVKRNRYFNYFILKQGEKILVNKRGEGDIWQHLYDFPLLETLSEHELFNQDLDQQIRNAYGKDVLIRSLMATKHVLTHQIIYVQFFALDNYIINFNSGADIKWVSRAELDELPQPKVIAVILVGHLGKDPEVRHLDGGVTVASFPLATSETYNKDGKRVEQTEWHNIVLWRGLAEVASKYLQKGKLVYIEGKLRTRSFEDREKIKKYVTEVVAENFTILGRKSDFEAAPVPATNQAAAPKHEDDFLDVDGVSGDLPF